MLLRRLTRVYVGLLTALAAYACVREYEPPFRATVNVVVVEGNLTDLPEKQFVKLSRSRADSLNGRFGTLPLAGARVELVVNSAQVVNFRETGQGTYELPTDFRLSTNTRYRLRFQLANGTRYESAEETMPAVPAIERVYERFNPRSIPATTADVVSGFVPANEFFIDTTDPANQQNFYRWEWKAYEKQPWCRTCYQGLYVVFDDQNNLVEDCQRAFGITDNVDFACRTSCWEILRSFRLNVFADTFTNGRPLTGRRVAEVPFLHYGPCLVEIRQASLTKAAYRYFRLLEQQTQNTGTLADTPPAPLVGNVRNPADERENVAGVFTVSAVSSVNYWLDRKANPGLPVAASLFEAMNGRQPNGGSTTALCVPSETRTPFKPDGWRE